MLSVRERPPLRLMVSVKTPAGPAYRWGADDPRAANKPQGLTFSTAMPGGFDQMSCTLERDPRLAYPDLQELADVQVLGPGGDVAWEGRLEEFPDTAGDQAQVSPQCVGYQAHLDDDNSASEIYVDGQLSKWGDPSLTRQIALLIFGLGLSSGQAATDPTTGIPAVVQGISDSWATTVPLNESWYDAGAGNLIAKVYYSLLVGEAAIGAWTEVVQLSDDANGTVTESSANLHPSAPVAGYFTPATPYRFAFLQHYNSVINIGSQGAVYNAYWEKLTVYGDHGLTLYGPDPQGVLASDVIAHAVGRWAPKIKFTTGPGGTIAPSSYVLTQLAFTPTTTSAIVKQAAQYELLDWAVWERTGGTDGPTLYVNDRGARGKVWRARVGPAQLQESGPQASRIWNGVVVSFTAVDGTTQTCGPPGSGATFTDPSLQDLDPQNPANEAGITRWAPLPLGTSTPSDAFQAGSVFLQAQREVSTAGQAAIVGHVQDTSGVWFPYHAVRGGDSVIFPDAHDTSPRRVVSTGCDDSTKTNTVQLDQPPDTTAALLERMSESIGPLGLS